jgi:hypothetical protein
LKSAAAGGLAATVRFALVATLSVLSPWVAEFVAFGTADRLWLLLFFDMSLFNPRFDDSHDYTAAAHMAAVVVDRRDAVLAEFEKSRVGARRVFQTQRVVQVGVLCGGLAESLLREVGPEHADPPRPYRSERLDQGRLARAVRADRYRDTGVEQQARAAAHAPPRAMCTATGRV